MAEMTELYGTISHLELQHKRLQLVNTYGQLMEAKRQLTVLLIRRHFHSLQYPKNFYYTHANKGGKYLAHLLKGNTPRTQVKKLRTTKGSLTVFLEEIASEFRNYYNTLYSLPAQEEPPLGVDNPTPIQANI
ncbi:Hypothetical predicted protein [Pelobates cultripes]|uniref:Uncharacterized protein n=1 Tax=Pelobates cultripes TaxID=61616 RepID=A0AAD1VIB6_PELCU|nr:Hypothetical predicted protein [Pelobates cultripes]